MILEYERESLMIISKLVQLGGTTFINIMNLEKWLKDFQSWKFVQLPSGGPILSLYLSISPFLYVYLLLSLSFSIYLSILHSITLSPSFIWFSLQEHRVHGSVWTRVVACPREFCRCSPFPHQGQVNRVKSFPPLAHQRQR